MFFPPCGGQQVIKRGISAAVRHMVDLESSELIFAPSAYNTFEREMLIQIN